MRLAQLARKIGVRPGEITAAMATTTAPVEESSNVRLTDEQIEIILTQFAAGRKAELWAEIRKEPETTETPAPQETEQVALAAEPEMVLPTAEPEIAVDTDPTVTGPVEVIKAQKVELSGLKVLGKIDLPEPKKKEPAAPAEGSDSTAPERRRDRRRDERPRNSRRESNPIAEQRAREAREKEERRREELAREKERKTNNYYKKVKPANPTRRARMVDEEVEEVQASAPAPKSLWGKFMRWLRT